MRLSLNALPAFRAVAELQNLRAAAERLHLTHSAVSQQIRGLEEQLGFDLFERSGRGIVLNPAGAALLCSVQEALALLDDGMRTAAAAAGSSTAGFGAALVRAALDAAAHGALARPSSGADVGNGNLAAGGGPAARWIPCGAALRARPLGGVESEPLFDVPLPLIALASPKRRAPCRTTPETLAGQPLLGERDVWQHWFNSAGLRIPVNPVATFNDAGMMLQAAEQGLGIALGRELLAADALCAGRLVQLSTVRVQYEQAQTYHLVYRPSLRDWPPLVALKQWLRDELELSRKSLVTYQPEDCAEGENPK